MLFSRTFQSFDMLGSVPVFNSFCVFFFMCVELLATSSLARLDSTPSFCFAGYDVQVPF